MTTMREAVQSVLSRLNGAMPGDLAVTTTDYVVGDDTLQLAPGVPRINPGTLVSLDLHDLYVTAIDNNGTMLTVTPLVSDEPSTVPAGSIARIRPAQSTREVFARLRDQIQAMSAPNNGLFYPAAADYGPSYGDNTYPVPEDWTVDPVRVLDVTYQAYGTGYWGRVNGWRWQPDIGAVRITGAVPPGPVIRVLYALPFAVPTLLSQDLTDDLGIPATMADIPVLGATADLALGLEGRRLIPTSQGDGRRAEEVPITAGSALARELRRAQNDRIQGERARLGRLFPYRQQDLTYGC